MCQPLKQIPRTSVVAWCATESGPNIMALGSSGNSAASVVGGGSAGDSSLEFVSFDLAKPGSEMDVLASIKAEGGHRFSSLSWSNFGSQDGGKYPYGILAGGLQEGRIGLWDPFSIVQSRGADKGLIHTSTVHQGNVNGVEFHPAKPNLMATCGADGEVNVLNIENPAHPDLYKPSQTASKHAGSEVLCCAWNRKVHHILCSSSNLGTTVVWDLKMKKEVISFQDPANRQRCSSVVWHPEVPTQLLIAYDDDRNPSMQMWDLRNCQYPFKETAGHQKGILDVAWNSMDPNLLLTCSKDNRTICWCLSSGTPEIFCDIPSQQWNFEVRWAPHRPSLFSAASFNGAVCLHSMQQQQTEQVRYCPRWYRRPCGASFGFGGQMLSFGVMGATTESTAAPNAQAAPRPTSSWCHSLVVPNEPDVVPAADSFDQWIAEDRLKEYCHEKTRRSGGTSQHEGLMWDLMGLQFEENGKQRVPLLLGLDGDKILKEVDGFLGRRPGSTLGGQAPEVQGQPEVLKGPSPKSLGPELDMLQAESFFDQLSAETEQKKQEEEVEQQKKQHLELAQAASASSNVPSTKNDWSTGPEALIKQALLTGNLTAAVECCFKNGRMAEALLLASGGGTTLWTRARDEYLRLQDDTFLSTVGNIMTSDFEKLVASSDLSNWMETLAILATYSGEHYRTLCEQLAERLEKEKFDIRSAVICYICAGNFQKTVGIWGNTHIASQRSQKLALQDLVEKMAVLQKAVRFNQTDTLFNAKLTQYAEILANSGRLTAAMRYLCLLRDDASSAILRDRIYNSAPQQMSAMFGGPPAFPFQQTEVRVMYQSPAQKQTAYNSAPMNHSGPQGHLATQRMTPAAHSGPMAGVPGPTHTPTATAPAPTHAPSPPGAVPMRPPAPYSNAPAPHVARPKMNMPPQPNLAGTALPTPGAAPFPTNPAANPVNFSGPVAPVSAPVASAGVMPHGMPHGAPIANPSAVSAPAPGPPRASTAPTSSAMPLVEGMPVAWPLPTKSMQQLSTNTTVAGANQAIQAASGAAAPIGEPMPPHELAHLRSVFGMLLEATQGGNVKKRDDIAKRLEELYGKLEVGQVKTIAGQKLIQVVQAVEAKDYAAASRVVQLELSKIDWEQNKSWVTGLKWLLPARA